MSGLNKLKTFTDTSFLEDEKIQKSKEDLIQKPKTQTKKEAIEWIADEDSSAEQTITSEVTKSSIIDNSKIEKDEMKYCTFRIPEATVLKLNKACKKHKLNKAMLVDEAIKLALNVIDK